ncbi:unnamed protein product [Rotaria sordida]|uniref:Multicopper oxidase n=1 Tax=Rotaria sordida TaxID=392033 RepID=A0A815G216_9BILA|nr:unnamed protein product [Rotaria sordida]CAF4021964.1 unnamed protein product [Rotaria sordida]
MQYGDGLKDVLIINDSHDPSYLYAGTMAPIPDTGLINGIGQFNCSSNKNYSYYRASIRTVYARITLTIGQHRMRLIEADGVYFDGNKYLTRLCLSPGQRYSVLITGKLNFTKIYWICATIHPFVDNNNYHTIIPSMDTFNNDALIINQSFTKREVFSNELGLISMNNTKFHVSNSQNIKTFIYNSKYNGQNPASVQVGNDEIIDVIINNIDFAPHPFHLHGHHVWILAQGNTKDGYFNQSTLDNILYNRISPIYRDTLRTI